MTTITCTKCNQEIELSEALTRDIEQHVLEAEHQKHAEALAKVEQESAEAAAKAIVAAEAKAQQDAAAKVELRLQQIQQEASDQSDQNKDLREQLLAMTTELRESRKARENAELEMHKKLAEEESKIREAAAREADERQRLNIAARDKTITDLQKALDDAQRKAAQGSQQLQGEIMELDLETALAETFREDDISPVAKGQKGGDIRHTVKTPRGANCGVMLWELKRTKNWTEGWIVKLKDDARAEKANIPIIVSEALPKGFEGDMGLWGGVWLCRPSLAIALATLLRKSLLDVAREKAIAENRGTKAESLYSYITSHEFAQQIESMIETYRSMHEQIMKERVAYEKFWTAREGQARKLLLSTANIVGGMQGQIGQHAMPKIKGLELLEAGDENTENAVDYTQDQPVLPPV